MDNTKLYFDPVSVKINFIEEEKKLIEYWYSKGIVKKYLVKNNTAVNRFSFLDGPITANNPMGVHHAWGRTYKDLWQRYKNMKGFRQRFQNGFDCQGLWVEVEVEKELGFKSKKDIDKYGVAKFIEKCKERVNKYSKIQTDQTIRLGNFMDWDHSYYTMSDENNYMIWYFLKVCHEKGLIYKGNDVVPWCYRCETAISEHEILTEDYKEVEHTALFIKFPLIEKNDEYLLVWTTTPWTIPANVAVSVDIKVNYSLIEYENNKYWVMESLVKNVFLKNFRKIKTVKGSELVGLKYKSAFDGLPSNIKVSKNKLFHSVVATDSFIMPISEDEGTGLVHTSTGTGAEDHKLGKKIGLPIMPAIADNADYLEDFGYLSGKNAKKNPEIIIEDLKNNDNGKYYFKQEIYKHRYPVCWRCKNELVWKLTDEWYIAIDPVRKDMIDVAKKIKWIPSFGLKRELDWLTNMHDWLISKKNRYWGLALPIWECKCGNFVVIGGYEELKEKAIKGWKEFEGHTPHKPYIDNVEIRCDRCGGNMLRIPDVGNPWLDAGIVPFSTISEDNKSEPLYLKNKNDFYKWFPTDFITESFPGQFKNWFYSVLAMSTILENKEPYKTVLGFATLISEDGRPMHKSWGNSIEFNEGAEKIGSDVMRWMYLSANPSENLLFGFHSADDVRRRFYLKLWNVYNFFVTYSNMDSYKKSIFDINSEKLSILDQWILSRLSETIEDVEKYIEKYQSSRACAVIETFTNDFSNWYIRRSRERVGNLVNDTNDRNKFYDTTYFTLLNISKLLAPFLPFISEMIYRNLTKKESVHLESWPKINNFKNSNLNEGMGIIRRASEVIHADRKSKNVSLRQPLLDVLVIAPEKEPNIELLNILSEEVNVRKINWKTEGDIYKCKLNLRITPELLEEAKTRELVRKIQNERKVLGVKLSDEVNVRSEWIPQKSELLELVKKKTLAKSIKKDKKFKVSV